ncbi:MAG: 4-oxalocrotonate tautomerase [Rhodobacteraceae bacterium]|nr:4-oxalocrotonate tautomerase [Paracoccaceae bacterium]
MPLGAGCREAVPGTTVGIEGEKMRGVTWVRMLEVASGAWRICGQAVTAEAVGSLQAGA